jgi:carboxy-terminal domain RNA polymerase II polypeptide A small phosphatase
VIAPGATNPVQDPSGLSPEDEASQSTTESPELSRKNRGLLHVPSRSSSQKNQPSPTSTGLSGATVSDPTDSIGGRSRESKGSIMGRRRNGSATSSKRSGAATGVTNSNTGIANASTSVSAPIQKPKKTRGFLGFLNCCGVPEYATGVDSDEIPLPVKKVTKDSSQAVPTTSSKPESSNLQSTSIRSTVPVIEKEALGQVDPVPNASADQVETSQAVSRGKSVNSQGKVDRKTSLRDARDQPLPAIPQDADKILEAQDSSANPSVVVQAPAAAHPRQDDQIPIKAQNQDGSDVSKDSLMAEASPITAEVPKASVTDQQEVKSKSSTLPPPPPPPLPLPEPAQNSANPSQESATAENAEEKQQWLLPPIEPRFHGKKCLVLDLDETLVHSSFKVTLILDSVICLANYELVDTPSS